MSSDKVEVRSSPTSNERSHHDYLVPDVLCDPDPPEGAAANRLVLLMARFVDRALKWLPLALRATRTLSDSS